MAIIGVGNNSPTVGGGVHTPTRATAADVVWGTRGTSAGTRECATLKALYHVTEVEKLKATAEADRKIAEQELTDTITRMEQEKAEAVQREKDKARAEVRRIISFIFFGGAAVSMALGVGCHTVLSGAALVGPKLIGGLWALGATLAATGVAILTVLDRPWIVYIGLGVAGEAYANH